MLSQYILHRDKGTSSVLSCELYNQRNWARVGTAAISSVLWSPQHMVWWCYSIFCPWESSLERREIAWYIWVYGVLKGLQWMVAQAQKWIIYSAIALSPKLPFRWVRLEYIHSDLVKSKVKAVSHNVDTPALHQMAFEQNSFKTGTLRTAVLGSQLMDRHRFYTDLSVFAPFGVEPPVHCDLGRGPLCFQNQIHHSIPVMWVSQALSLHSASVP